MNPHSERQSFLLKRMGIDVWKLRQPAKAAEDIPLSETPAQNKAGEQSSKLQLPSNDIQSVDSDAKAQLPSADDSASSSASLIPPQTPVSDSDKQQLSLQDGSNGLAEPRSKQENLPFSAEQANATQSGIAEISEFESTSKIVSWRAVLNLQEGAKWCFVCAFSDKEEAVQIKLLEAIVFSLGLSDSDYSLVQAFAVREHGAELHQGSGVKDILSSMLEKEQPQVIVVLGEQLAQFLIGTDKSVDVLRNENYRYQGGTAQLMVTFGLEDLLENSMNKAKAWHDLQKLIPAQR